jgi:hypothetical protein
MLGLLAFSAAGLHAQQRSALFIGNSYTYVNDLPGTTRLLALSLGDTLNVASSAPGGYTFEQHSTNATTLGLIASQPWDFVVLQEQSQRPSFPPAQVEQEVYPFAAQLVANILTNDSCTQPVFYMTWGRKNGDASNCGSWPPVCTYEGMQQRLRESYLEMAFANDAFAAPIGVAWKKVRETHPLIELYNADESHPSPEGTYLAAAVFYSTLYRRPSITASYTAAINADTAAILRSIASSTALDSLGTWNIGVNDPDAGFTFVDQGGGNVQFMHGGAGDHQWVFSDGGIATTASPLQHFATGGLYTATHIWTDVCGRSDTATAEFNLLIAGIGCHDAWPRPMIGAIGQGQVLIARDATSTGTIDLFDPLGRHIQGIPITSTDRVVNCPSGLFIWRSVSSDGTIRTGRLVVP